MSGWKHSGWVSAEPASMRGICANCEREPTKWVRGRFLKFCSDRCAQEFEREDLDFIVGGLDDF